MALAALACIAIITVLLHLPVVAPWWTFCPLLALTIPVHWYRRRWRGTRALARLGLRTPGQRCGLMVLVLLASLASSQAQRWQARVLPGACENLPLTAVGSVAGLVDAHAGVHGDRYLRFSFAVDALSPRRCAGPRTLLLYWTTDANLQPGDRLRLEASLKRPWGFANPHSRNAQARYFAAGVHARGSVRAVHSRESDRRRVSAAALHRLRGRLSERVRTTLPGNSGPLMAALLVGDRRALNDTFWQRLRAFGLTHLLVISGLHVSMAAAAGWALGGALARATALVGAGQRRRILGPVLAALLATAYTALSGWGLPALRALCMLLPALAVLGARRAGSGWQLLALALVVLLLWRPAAGLGPSLWLSVGAVALLLWAAAWEPPAGRLRRAAVLQLYMVLAMLPVGLHVFAVGATAGALANLAAAPLVGLWVLPAGLLGIALEVAGTEAAPTCWQLAAAPLAVFWDALGYWQPAVEAHALLRGRPPATLLVLALLAALLLPLPGTRRRVALALLLGAPLLLAGPPRPPPVPEITVFDVGQGTAVLVRDGRHAMLYDTGGGGAEGRDRASEQIIPYLRAEGIERLELVIISHADADHSAGLESLQAALPIGDIWTGVDSSPDTAACRLGRRRRLGDRLTLQVLSSAQPGDSDNDSSCVVSVTAGSYRVLLPGDIEKRRERDLVAFWGRGLRAQVLLAAHHGSQTSSSRLWLRHVAPQHVVVTAARANRFGHPAPPVVAAVREAGAVLWNTAFHGAVTLRLGEGGWEPAPTRHAGRPFWWLWEDQPHQAAY